MNPIRKPLFTKGSVIAASAAVAASLTWPTLALALTPPVDRVGRPAKVLCNLTPAGVSIFAAHADKIVFKLSGALIANDPPDQMALNAIPRETELDIKVLDDPSTIADLKGKVLTFIGAGDNAANRQAVTIDQVLYAMVCPSRPAN